MGHHLLTYPESVCLDSLTSFGQMDGVTDTTDGDFRGHSALCFGKWPTKTGNGYHYHSDTNEQTNEIGVCLIIAIAAVKINNFPDIND